MLVSFNNFGLSPEVVRGTQAMGFTEPTPIQLRAFPIILAGKDLDRHRANRHRKNRGLRAAHPDAARQHGQFRCLVLEPTRELAAQVETAFRDYGRFTDLSRPVVHGGVGYGKQREEAANAASISSWPRRAACSIISNRARSIFATSTFWCSMKSIACSTWDFCRMCAASLKKFRPIGRHCFFQRPSAGDRAAGRMGSARSGDGRNRRAPFAGGNRDARGLSGRGGTKI